MRVRASAVAVAADGSDFDQILGSAVTFCLGIWALQQFAWVFELALIAALATQIVSETLCECALTRRILPCRWGC